MATVCERITALREKMKENGITVYVGARPLTVMNLNMCVLIIGQELI